MPSRGTPHVDTERRSDPERKDRVLNVRVSERQRRTYERAADIEGTSVSALVTSAADARADSVLHAQVSMTVASDVFDELLTALDQPTALSPTLERALRDQRFRNR